MRRKVSGLVGGAAVLVAGILGMLVMDMYLYRRVIPPSEVGTLAAFLRWRPEGNRFVRHEVGGRIYVEALGGQRAILPSGAAGYVFDDGGRMVDWTSDTGDDNRYQEKWQGNGKKLISREEAVGLLGGEPRREPIKGNPG